jgi:predicted transcriptional regulator
MDLPAEQARKLAVLNSLVEEGMADVEAGRVVPWDLKEFLKRAHEKLNRSK